MISASIAGTHRFGRVKRKGYDPAEVDAVVGRLLDALSSQDERAKELERRLDESHVSATAIARTLAAVELTRAEILEEATVAAEMLVAGAKDEAAEIARLADALGAEVSARRDAILTEAYSEADTLLAGHQMSIAEQAIDAARLASDLIGEATRNADRIDAEAATRARASAVVAAWRMRESHKAAEAAIADAEVRAATIVESAERESDRLGERIADLRAAVSNLQASAADLARTTIAGADIIDLTAIEAREGMAEPRPVKLAPVPSDTNEGQDPPDGPATYYQRRTGGIKERIKIARSTP